MEILNTELQKINSDLLNVYNILSKRPESNNGIYEFTDEIRLSTELFDHRRGLSLDIVANYDIDINSILRNILSEDTNKKIESLFTVKGRQNYCLAVYGKPHREQEWGFSIDGPLLSLNFTIKGSEFSVVPMLIGNYNPNIDNDNVKDNPMITEIGIPSDFMSMLDEEQLKKALISKTSPTDLIYAYSENLSIIPAGMPLTDINTEDQKFFLGMILSVYLNRLKPNMAKSFNAKLFSESTNNYKLAWRGGLEMEDKFYYSLSSKKMVIEFIKINEGNSDIITVIREKEYDYGIKLLNKEK